MKKLKRRKAMKRNSRQGFEFRELLAGVKQLRRTVELALERLPQILICIRRVDADGTQPLSREDIEVYISFIKTCIR